MRTQNDWGALCLAELEGRESPGTVARLITEETGHKAEAGADVLQTLVQLGQLLSSPAAVQKRIGDLASAEEREPVPRLPRRSRISSALPNLLPTLRSR
jgi:hypothetical protein